MLKRRANVNDHEFVISDGKIEIRRKRPILADKVKIHDDVSNTDWVARIRHGKVRVYLARKNSTSDTLILDQARERILNSFDLPPNTILLCETDYYASDSHKFCSQVRKL